MKYSLNAGEWNSVFAVPSGIVDKYIKLASGNSLKLLLFLLRHGGESFSDSEIREALGFRADGELEDAAVFWIQRGVIRYDTAKTTDSENALLPSSKKPQADGISAENAPEQLTLADEPNAKSGLKSPSVRKVGQGSLYYSRGDIADRIKADAQIEFLFKEAQNLYGRSLNAKEEQTVIALTDHYGLTAVVAVMLLKYCFQAGKTTPNYITAVAQNWCDDNIATMEQANARIAALERRGNVEQRLRTAMEFKTKFTAKQTEFIRVWTEEWGFGEDMIMLAYDITVNATGEMSFPYANSVLNNWFNDGIFTREDAEKRSEQRKGAAKKAKPAVADSGNSSFDVDDVLAQIRSRYQKN